MAVVGGRTALVDLSLSSVSNATGNFLTISGGVVHQRTPSETRSDVGAQAQLNGTGFVKASGTTITYDNSTYQVTSEKAQPNGYASLDSNGKVPLVQINDALIGNVNFQGLWNAATNTPTLANPPASGTKGYYYIVSTAGTFAGISFEVGDWIISDGTAWGKVDNTDAVSSVFGRTGNVTATNGDYNTSQVTENTNLYYTDGRARGALSFVAGSGAYNSTTGVITIPTNNNQITNGAGYITSAALGAYLPLTGGTLTGPLNGTSASFSIVISTTNLGFENNNAIQAGFVANYTGTGAIKVSFSTYANTFAIYDETNGRNIISQNTSTQALLFTGAATFSSSVTATSIIRSGGTSSQFLKADGSVDSNSYYLASNPSAFIALTALSGTAPIQYNNTTGAISITQASGSTNGFLSSTDWNTFNNKTSNVGTVTSVAALTLGTSGTDLSSTVANGTTTPVITLNVPTASAANRGALSAADWTTFNSKENAITAGTTAQYYRGDKTFQTLNTAAVPELTNLYYTEARVNANANVAANTAARHNAVTLGTANGLSLSTQQLSLGLASSSANGALSSTDWTTFNNKQNALTNPVTGTGTTNYLPKFTGSTTIGNSQIFDNGTNVGIGISNPNIYDSNADNLVIGSTGANDKNGITIVGGDTDGRGAIYFADTTQNSAGFITYLHSNNRLLFGTSDTTRVTLDASGNLGLGVTPSAWSGVNALQVVAACLYSNTATSGMFLSANAFFDGAADRYINTRQASRYYQLDGIHVWQNAPSGTAGNAISFTQAMTLGSNSGLSIGTPSAAPSQGLLVQGAANFNSSVTAGGYITGQGNNPGGLGGSRYVLDWLSGQMRLFSYGANSSTNGGFLFNSQRSDGTNSINYLDISSTGAATFSSTLQTTHIGINNAPTLARLFATQTTDGEWIATFKNYGGIASFGVSIDMSNSTSGESAFQVYTSTGNGLRLVNNSRLLIGTFTDSGYQLDVNGTGRFSGSLTVNSGASATTTNFTNNGDFVSNWIGNSTVQLFSIRNNSTTGVFLNTQNSAPLRLGVSTGTTGGTIVNHFEIASTGAATFSSTLLTEGNLTTRTTNSPTQSILLNAIPVNDNSISLISFGARFNSTTYGTGAQIRASAAGTWSSTNYGTNLIFSTVTQNTDVNTERLIISASGTVRITNLAGSGSRMVVADANGLLSTQAISTGTVTNVTASSPLFSSGGATPNITIQQASGSQNGFLSSTDWTTFNNKVSGSGTAGQVAYWSSGSAITGESNLFWDATNDRLGIGVASPTAKLDINGDIRTAAPTGTSTEFWKLGRALLATSSDPEDRWIRVQLGTRIYDILAIDRGLA
jgi:hypothetical protein